MSKERLDQRLVAQGLAPSRERAKALIMSGVVLVDETPATKAGMPVKPDSTVRLKQGAGDDYASRGAHKLAPALSHFSVDPKEAICLDVGASTGGFTDVLLRQGASRVYAVDVGYGQLVWRLQNDSRVVVVDRTNARNLSASEVPEAVDLVVMDVSFISVTLILPALHGLCRVGAELLIMVKPQFEVGKGKVGKGGVVRDPAVREAAIDRVEAEAVSLGFQCHGRRDNDITGPRGNRECFLYLTKTN